MDPQIGLLTIFGFTLVLVLVQWMLLSAKSAPNRQLIHSTFRHQLMMACTNALFLAETESSFTVQVGGQTGDIQLEQLFRRCQEKPARTDQYIQQAVTAVQQAFAETDSLPGDWERRVLPRLLRDDAPLPPGVLLHPVVDELMVGYTLEGDAAYRWMLQEELATTDCTAEELHTLALANLERSCNALVIEALGANRDERDRLIRFQTSDGLDAARLLLPTLYQRFSPRFGDVDLLVAIPTRDTLVMVGVQDQGYINWLARQGEQNMAQRAYPLFTVPLRVTEHGIESA